MDSAIHPYVAVLSKATQHIVASCPFAIEITWDDGALEPAREFHELVLARGATSISFRIEHKLLLDTDAPEYGMTIARIGENACRMLGPV